jgi:hypothetical protein
MVRRAAKIAGRSKLIAEANPSQLLAPLLYLVNNYCSGVLQKRITKRGLQWKPMRPRRRQLLEES